METSNTIETKLLNFLHGLFPESAEIPDEELIKTLQSLLEKASGYGLESENDFTVYIITAYLLGVDFDTESPAVSKILSETGVTASEKARNLQNWTQQLLHSSNDPNSIAVFSGELDQPLVTK